MPHVLDPPTDDAIHVWRIDLAAGGGRAAARRALGEILVAYLGGDGAELARGADGKPRLARDPGRLSFNLSHSGGLALVAIAPGGVEVGVDVERLRRRRDLVRLAERWLPAADAAAVAAAAEDEREPVFYAAWTRHEARVKCTGTGLAGPPPGPEVVAHQLAIDTGYAAAVAVAVAVIEGGGAAPGAGIKSGAGAERGAGARRGAPRIVLRDASCRG